METSIQPVLLRSAVVDGRVSTVSSGAGTALPDMSVTEFEEVAGRLPAGGRYALMPLSLPDGVVLSAARRSGDETFFYMLRGPGAEELSSTPGLRIGRTDQLPLVTPALVALLGYTPWELTGGDLTGVLASAPAGRTTVSRVLDRWGSVRSLVHRSSRMADGSLWISVLPAPGTPDEAGGAGWESRLSSWLSTPPSGRGEELERAASCLGASGALLLERTQDGMEVVASAGAGLPSRELQGEELLKGVEPETSEWIELEDGESAGHFFIRAFAGGRFAAVLSGLAGALDIEARTALVLPILALRLDLGAGVPRTGAPACRPVEGRSGRADEAAGVLDRLPGGVALYDGEGSVLVWSGWFETMSGIAGCREGAAGGSELLAGLCGPRVAAQLRLALEGVFLPESVEALAGGRRCLSKMLPGPGRDQVLHLLIDARSAGMEEVVLQARAASPSPPATLDALAAACASAGLTAGGSPQGTLGLQPEEAVRIFSSAARALSGILSDRTAVLSTGVPGNAASASGRAILPAPCAMVTLAAMPVLPPGADYLLAAVDRELAPAGAWCARSGEDRLTLGMPLAAGPGAAMTALFSPDPWFRGLAEPALASLGVPWERAETLEELVEIQERSRALVLRLKPGETGLAASLAARVPGQEILVATGLPPRVVPPSAGISVLQLPAHAGEVLEAIRRTAVG